MHLQEVFRAIYANHIYEYLVIDKSYKVIEYSDRSVNYCNKSLLELNSPDVFELVPELIGMESKLDELLYETTTPILIRHVFKEPDSYVNIRVHRGKAKETLIILFENVTEAAKKDQALIQDANDKALLLDELAEKNEKLRFFSEKMQELVEIETKKNIEKQKMLELSSRHAQMGEMMGMITHQWKQPLNAISTVCALLEMLHERKKLTDETLVKQIGEIKNQVAHMNATVEDFQHFFNPSKIKYDFNVKETIKTIINLIKVEYGIRNITVELTGDDDVFINGYANEYNQVVLSILKNAKDAFMQHPKEGMQITIDVAKKENRSYVTIRDNAGGIDEDIIDKIFDVYVSTKSGGSGLGLSISKNIIQAHMNGEITVRNVEGGAEFVIVV